MNSYPDAVQLLFEIAHARTCHADPRYFRILPDLTWVSPVVYK